MIGRVLDNRNTLGLVFMTPRFFPYAKQVLELLQVHARIPLLAGCSSTALVTGAEELEDNPGLVLALYAMPGAKLTGTYFTQAQVEEVERGETELEEPWIGHLRRQPSPSGVADREHAHRFPPSRAGPLS